MTDKSPSKEQAFGCGWNDPAPRFKGNVHKGEELAVSAVDGLNPAVEDGLASIKHIPSER